ncbi:MAG: hypothetical protein HC866_10675 [Leptolyngbyaceae cyanobacterium RU_5_1]|nr:hypothetical protein [Leptolyngbyaceae cyanobacterium RU_5_1]
MLVKTELVQTPSVKRLVKAWTQVYTPNFRAIAFAQDPSLYTQLAEAVSSEGRAKTAAKLNQRILKLRCEIASIETNRFYTYLQNVMDLHEVKRIAETSFKIYTGLMDFYQHDLLSTTSAFTTSLSPVVLHPDHHSLDLINLSDIERLADALEPVLLEFQDQQGQAKDWQTLGVITTQLNFCNQWITDKLTPLEQVLLGPYLQFVEEQVAHPWRRVCAMAGRYSVDSPVLAIAEKMIPRCEEIAQSAYESLTRLLPNHYSRRGRLTHPGIAHSCVRDFKIFQSYLWLCVLEDSLVSVEQELLSLCVAVLPGIGVQWEMMELWTQVLADELVRRIEPFQQPLVTSYTTGMHQVFLKARAQLDTSRSRQMTA